jgi:hypothetical protein
MNELGKDKVWYKLDVVNWSLGIDELQYISGWYKRALVNYFGINEVCRLWGSAHYSLQVAHKSRGKTNSEF